MMERDQWCFDRLAGRSGGHSRKSSLTNVPMDGLALKQITPVEKARWLEEATGWSALREVQGALEGALFGVDLLLQLQNGIEQCLGPRRAPGNVYVDGQHLVAALHDRVVVEDAAGSRAGAHGDDPLGFGHLIVKMAND